jgi:nucleotide-binding universal stress UspA family protein
MLLLIDTYPEATKAAAVDQAIGFARLLQGRLTAIAVEVALPLGGSRVADDLFGLGGLVLAEESKSRDAGALRLGAFTERAKAAGVFAGAEAIKVDLQETSRAAAREAVTRDLCLAPLGGRFDDHVELVQTILFGSSRPAIIFRPGTADLPADDLGLVVLAWDGSPTAAAAMHEALPLLQRAVEVRVVTFVDEKASAIAGVGIDAIRHLSAYGVNAVAEEIPCEGRRIGDCLDLYVSATKPALLVMGAYGHSRLREVILGGATDHALRSPKVATFLAH